MGGQHRVLHPHQGGIRAGLIGEHVHGGTGQMPAFQGLLQGRHVHDRAPGGVEKIAARLHLLEGGLIEHPLGFRRQGHAGGHKIALFQQFVQGGVLHPVCLRPGRLGMAAGIEDAHIEGPGPPGQLLADAAEAHQAQGPVLGPQAHLPMPDAPMHLVALPLHVPGKVQQQGHQMLRHGPLHLAHGADHGDAQPLAGGQVHGIVADAPAGDQLQVGTPFQQVRRIAFQPCDHRVRVPNIGAKGQAPRADAQLLLGLVQYLKPGVRQQPPGFLVRIVSRQDGNPHVSMPPRSCGPRRRPRPRRGTGCG